MKGNGSSMLLCTTTHCHNPNDNHKQEADKDHYTAKWYDGCKGWNSDPEYNMTGKVNTTCHVFCYVPQNYMSEHSICQSFHSHPLHNCELCNCVTKLLTNYMSMSTNLFLFGLNPICLLNTPSITSIHTAKSLNLVITDF